MLRTSATAIERIRKHWQQLNRTSGVAATHAAVAHVAVYSNCFGVKTAFASSSCSHSMFGCAMSTSRNALSSRVQIHISRSDARRRVGHRGVVTDVVPAVGRTAAARNGVADAVAVRHLFSFPRTVVENFFTPRPQSRSRVRGASVGCVSGVALQSEPLVHRHVTTSSLLVQPSVR